MVVIVIYLAVPCYSPSLWLSQVRNIRQLDPSHPQPRAGRTGYIYALLPACTQVNFPALM